MDKLTGEQWKDVAQNNLKMVQGVFKVMDRYHPKSCKRAPHDTLADEVHCAILTARRNGFQDFKHQFMRRLDDAIATEEDN